MEATLNIPGTRTHQPIVTGTSVIGLKYKDGVLLAADTLASYGSMARFRDVSRLKGITKETVLGASGEYSDFQYILRMMEEKHITDVRFDDGCFMNPKEIHEYITRVLYQRRTKLNPYWNSILVGGYRNGERFLGLCDLKGTAYEDDAVATGLGAYMAMPLLRDALKETPSSELTLEQAQELINQCLRVLVYRDCRTLNKFQMANVDSTGVHISKPYELTTSWNKKGF